MNLLYVNNTSDIRALRSAVKSLENALATERNLADRLEKQRNREAMEANVFATMTRTLARQLTLSEEDRKKLREDCRRLCEEDLKKRGIKNVLEHPPNFFLK